MCRDSEFSLEVVLNILICQIQNINISSSSSFTFMNFSLNLSTSSRNQEQLLYSKWITQLKLVLKTKPRFRFFFFFLFKQVWKYSRKVENWIKEKLEHRINKKKFKWIWQESKLFYFNTFINTMYAHKCLLWF